MFPSAFGLTAGGAGSAEQPWGTLGSLVPSPAPGILLQTGNCGLAISEPNPSLFITKVSLEFLPRAWKKAVRPRCFRLKTGPKPAFFSKLGPVREFPTKC